MKPGLFFVFLFFTLDSYASTRYQCFPDSPLRYEANTKAAFDNSYIAEKVTHQFQKIFTPYVNEKLSKELKIKIAWDDDRVNAHATKDDNGNPLIVLDGGMVRHPKMKEAGLYFILCHELGHFLGGAPKQFRGRSKQRSWSSAEGQADYFAATKCLPHLFTKVEIPISSNVKTSKICENELCQKIIESGLNATTVFATLRPWWLTPELLKADQSISAVTILDHPRPQCRMDTVISGTFCDKLDEDFHPTNPTLGACEFQTVSEENNYTGARPKCWYKHKEIFD